MNRAKLPPQNMSIEKTLTLTSTVIQSISGNPFYPTPPSLAELQTGYNTLDTCAAKAKYGSRQDRAACRAAKTALIDLLRDMALYVNYTATTEEALASAGFPLSKPRTPSVLGVAVPSLANGDTSGVLTSATPRVTGAVSYKHQYTADAANGPWQEVVTSRSKAKLANLTPGTVYSSRIVAIGTGDQLTVSDVVSRMSM